MQTLSQKMRGQRRSIMTSEIQYLLKFHQQGRLGYSQVAAMKMPIGSDEERKFNSPSRQFTA